MAVCTNVERVNVPKFGADASDKYLASFLTVCSVDDSRFPPRAISLPDVTVSFWTLFVRLVGTSRLSSSRAAYPRTSRP